MDVYDLHIEEDHSFHVNNVPVHNSTICQDLSGKKFFYTRSGLRILPPAHPNCRSTTVDILANEPAPKFETFPEWAKKDENQDELEEAMGTTRYKLFKDGKLKIERFNNAHYKPLTLETLKRQNEYGFEKAGL